jgi:hypothetical protein
MTECLPGMDRALQKQNKTKKYPAISKSDKWCFATVSLIQSEIFKFYLFMYIFRKPPITGQALTICATPQPKVIVLK